MECVLKTLVGRETIMSHAAAPVDADDFFQDISTALRVDGVERGSVVTDPVVEPGRVPSDAPTGFIGCQMFGVLDVLLDLFINRLEDLAGPANDLGSGAGS